MKLPRQLTPFIGRQEELDTIIARLRDVDCCLLNIVGAGGVGKTRLALQAAAQVAPNFANGVHFVPLQAISVSQSLVAAMAEALQLTLTGQVAAEDQLFAFLQEKQLLLVLDNLEHLLDQATMLSALLHAGAQVKLLVTSREVLSLQEEWVYWLGGMKTPQDDFHAEAQAMDAVYDAVKFFYERLRRVHHQYTPDEENAAIVRICQLVEGVPLALELAASWAGTMSCAEIALEIEKNISFLSTELRNLPDRHRSMRAVFDQTWQRLQPEEQAAFRQLSVFRGTFRRHAAQAIATATLPILSALVNKSLLQWEAEGSYHLHALLRQFAEEQLMASPLGNDVHERHCVYYCDFLQQRLVDIHAGRQLEAMRAMSAELDNLRAAWAWAATHARVHEIRRALHALVWYWQYQSRYQEAADALHIALHSLEMESPAGEQGLALAEVLVQLGWLCIRLGRLEQAAKVLTQSAAIYHSLVASPISDGGSDPVSALALIAVLRGDIAEGITLLNRARTEQEARGDERNLSTTYYVLTAAYIAQGNYTRAEACAQQAHRLALAVHDQWSLAYILNDMGMIALLLGQSAEAKQHYRTSYAIRRQFNDREGMAVALRQLGQIALHEGAIDDAVGFLDESQRLYAGTGDLGGQAATLEGLGRVMLSQGQYAAASAHLLHALQIMTRVRLLALTCAVLTTIAELLQRAGEPELAQVTLDCVQAQPACPKDVYERARLLSAQSEVAHAQSPHLERPRFAIPTDADAALATVIAHVQATLARVAAQPPPPQTVAEPPHAPHSQTLIEPLTPRELDVLRLLAAGLSNPEIAAQLIVAVGTVKSYTNRIYGKLGVQNRVQAIARAQELSLL